MHLSEWARRHGVPERMAYRQFHAGTLADPVTGRRVAAQQTPSGSILVVDVGQRLGGVTPEELVDFVESAGYVVLRSEEARALGVHR